MIHAALLYDRYQTLGIQGSSMTLTEMWMHIGTMLVTQWDPPTCANTWEFMLFCVVSMSRADEKLRAHCCAQSRKPFKFARVGACWRIILGTQSVTNMPPETTNIAKTLQIHCVLGQWHTTHVNHPRNACMPVTRRHLAIVAKHWEF